MKSACLLFFLMSCSGMENSEQSKMRQQNAFGEYIYRSRDETLSPPPTPQHRERPPYPWETEKTR